MDENKKVADGCYNYCNNTTHKYCKECIKEHIL